MTGPRVGVGVVLFRGASVLLVRRSRAPLLGQWSFPGGRQEWGETVEAAARRELREETGMEAGTLRFAGYVDAVHRADDGAIAFHYTILDLAGFASDDRLPVAGSDAGEARFVPVRGLARLGVDAAHRAMVRRAREALRGVGRG